MRFSLSATLPVAVAAFAYDAAAQLSGEEVLSSLTGLISTLQSAGDSRVKLQQETPNINTQTVVAFENALHDAFVPVESTIIQNNLSDENNIGTLSDAQQSALCALLPKVTQAGEYAIDGLMKLPTFQDVQGPAFDAEFDLGLILERLSIQFNWVAWSLYSAGAAAKCEDDSFAILQGFSRDLDNLSNYLLY